MDITLMKQDFYKRFDAADSYLNHERCGLLCTLLGFSDINSTASLTYPLSVGVTGLCRSTSSDSVILESTDSDTLYSHRINYKNLSGGQILIDNQIPEYFNSSAELKCCLLKCVMNMSEIYKYDFLSAASACCGKENIKPYLSLLNSRPGYCVLSQGDSVQCLPLPLSGFKLISIQFDKPFTFGKAFKEIEEIIEYLKTRYPHISSLSDLTLHDLEGVKNHIKNKTVYNRLGVIIRDNMRINSAAESLKACRSSELFNQMNLSSRDILRYWKLEPCEAELLKAVLETEGVRAARFWHKGVIAAAYEDRVDYILSMIENSFKNSSQYDVKFCISN